MSKRRMFDINFPSDPAPKMTGSRMNSFASKTWVWWWTVSRSTRFRRAS